MKSFVPIASRTITFVPFASDRVSHKITVAVSAPYKPPRDRSVGANAACMVLTSDDPQFAYEVYGVDEMEALQVAIANVQVFLRELVNSKAGELRTEEGTPFDLEAASPFLRKYLEFPPEGERP